MKSFSSAIISDSQPCTNPMLPAWTASVGWGLGILLGSAIGIHRIVNSDIALSGLLLCFEIFLHYTLCTARDPKSTDLSCKLIFDLLNSRLNGTFEPELSYFCCITGRIILA